ncbi:hypothetical protein DFJ74DRAFT_693466 [Hyaloraphidium curvatum]|nr:hypothetical protein DFJ74DRAFT_693466 [Hyaloraphidium curvatum]
MEDRPVIPVLAVAAALLLHVAAWWPPPVVPRGDGGPEGGEGAAALAELSSLFAALRLSDAGDGPEEEPERTSDAAEADAMAHGRRDGGREGLPTPRSTPPLGPEGAGHDRPISPRSDAGNHALSRRTSPRAERCVYAAPASAPASLPHLPPGTRTLFHAPCALHSSSPHSPPWLPLGRFLLRVLRSRSEPPWLLFLPPSAGARPVSLRAGPARPAGKTGVVVVAWSGEGRGVYLVTVGRGEREGLARALGAGGVGGVVAAAA